MPNRDLSNIINSTAAYIEVLLGDQYCNSTGFICTDGNPKCIPSLWVCDGEQECEDASDESEKFCGGLMVFFITVNISELQITPSQRNGLVRLSILNVTLEILHVYHLQDFVMAKKTVLIIAMKVLAVRISN